MGYKGQHVAKRENYRDVRENRPPSFVCHLPGILITAVLFILMLTFDAMLITSKLLPNKYLLIAIGALFVLVIILMLLVWNCRNKGRFWVGFILSLLVGGMLFYGINAAKNVTGFFNRVTSTKTEVAQMAVYVRMDDPAQELMEMTDYAYGILATADQESTDEAVSKLEENLETDIETVEYDTSFTGLVDGLLNEDVDAIIMNAAYLDTLRNQPGYEDIDSRIRLVDTYHVERVIKTREKSNKAEVKKTNDIYTVYISGSDSRSGLGEQSRSDVNIIATVNPGTKQIVLISTPRDYYVPLSNSGGSYDKLTHAGLYGVNVSMETLELLYDIDIDYYFRVDFGGFKEIVDSLDGVTVYSDLSFTSYEGYYFEQGDNYVYGDEALAFVRERKAFAEGDIQRGRNQMAMIKAIAKKAMSPEILWNYTSLLNALEGSFDTSVPYDLIAKLVSDQLDSGSEWNIVSYTAYGYGNTRSCWSLGGAAASVLDPDYDTVETAKELMRQVRDGEVVSNPAS